MNWSPALYIGPRCVIVSLALPHSEKGGLRFDGGTQLWWRSFSAAKCAGFRMTPRN